jgi:hypothetical protein
MKKVGLFDLKIIKPFEKSVKKNFFSGNNILIMKNYIPKSLSDKYENNSNTYAKKKN